MPLKSNAEVTVDGEQHVSGNVGYATESPQGTTGVKVPQHVAKDFEVTGGATKTADAVES